MKLICFNTSNFYWFIYIYADTLKTYLQESHVPYLFEDDESKILYPPTIQLTDIIKHKAISIDLNNDGVNEVIAYTEGSLVCGSGGCTSYILKKLIMIGK